MLKSWKSLETLEIGGFTVDDHPLTYSRLSLPHLKSITFIHPISACRSFIRHLVNETSDSLRHLNLTNSSIISSTRHPFSLPTTLVELHCSDQRLLGLINLPSLTSLRLHACCQNYEWLLDLPSLTHLAVFITDSDSLNALSAALYSPRPVAGPQEHFLYHPEIQRKRVSPRNLPHSCRSFEAITEGYRHRQVGDQIREIVVYSPSAAQLAAEQRMDEKCRGLNIRFTTARQWSKWSQLLSFDPAVRFDYVG